MFDVETAVARWRESLAAIPVSVHDELEDHLRASIDDLRRHGLTYEEAFLVAARRLGSASQLDAEFEKVSGTVADRPVRWMLVGAVAALALPQVAQGVAGLAAFAGSAVGVDGGLLACIMFVTGGVVFALPARALLSADGTWSARLRRWVEGHRPTARSRVLVAAAVVAVLVLANMADIAFAVGTVRVVSAPTLIPLMIGRAALQHVLTLGVVASGILLVHTKRRARRGI